MFDLNYFEMKILKLSFLLAFAGLVACSEDDGVMTTCTDGIQNGDETGIDCGGSCTPCVVSCSNEVTFDNTGQYGENLLRSASSGIDTLQIGSLDVLSMQASTSESCTSLMVVITNITADCENCWFYFPELNENWNVSEYNFSNNSQTFTSSGTEMDLSIDAFFGGVYRIDYLVNGNLTHTNFLQSNEDELIPFIEGEFMSGSRKGSNLLYTLSSDVSFVGKDSYFGIIDLNDPASGVQNQYIANASTIALRDDIVYYWDFVSNEIKSVDILNPNAGTNRLVRNVVDDLEFDGISGMVFDGNMLYFGFFSFRPNVASYLGRIDVNADQPEIEIVLDDFPTLPDDAVIVDQVLYTTSFLSGDLISVDLSDQNFPLTILPNYFGEGFRSINSIDITETHIYYAEQGIVGRVSRDTGEREVLIQTNLSDAFYGIHVEEDFILFSEEESETIYKQDL